MKLVDVRVLCANAKSLFTFEVLAFLCTVLFLRLWSCFLAKLLLGVLSCIFHAGIFFDFWLLFAKLGRTYDPLRSFFWGKILSSSVWLTGEVSAINVGSAGFVLNWWFLNQIRCGLFSLLKYSHEKRWFFRKCKKIKANKDTKSIYQWNQLKV